MSYILAVDMFTLQKPDLYNFYKKGRKSINYFSRKLQHFFVLGDQVPQVEDLKDRVYG